MKSLLAILLVAPISDTGISMATGRVIYLNYKMSILMKLTIWIFTITFLSFIPDLATAEIAQDHPTFSENSIKRYMFSMDTFAAIEMEFSKRKVLFTKAPKAPTAGKTTRVMGTGTSGFPTPFIIEHVAGRFHAYAERRRPQHPVAPLPYRTQDVVFDTPDPAVSPIGTLSYPKTGGPFPAVVLVAGSGPHNRDAGMSLHKTLLVLADHLTRQGFAVLRYDKRGVGLTGGNLHPNSTTDDYTADAIAAVRFLKLQANIDLTKVGIVGHSEGGIIAAMAAAEAPNDVSFIAMLAGTGLPGMEIKSLQDAAERRAGGMPESHVLLFQSHDRELFEIAASKRTHPEALAAMRAAYLALPVTTKETLGLPPADPPEDLFEALLSPWFRRFLSLDPRPYLEKVTCPTLALIGEKDMQVPAAENLKEIGRVLKVTTNRASPLTSVRQLPGLNHNFQTAKTGQVSEYFLIEETIAPSALALLSSWMQEVVHKRK
nr:alpha/beta fold hydrolase [uncultured Undibacterium sp.]